MQDGTFKSTCWECSVNCGSIVTVKGGEVASIGPDPEHPYSKGNFCLKGIRGATGLRDHPDRLLHPMKRTGPRGGGQWARISWDEALDSMADRLAEVRRAHGARSLVAATSGAYFSRSVITALMMRSMGSPNWMINQDLCGGCRAVSARVTGLDIDAGGDIAHTRCALVVGRNPAVADPVQWAELKTAKKRGARIVAVDPKRTPVAEIADLWLRPRVGTDAALALGMAQVIIAEGLYDRDFVARWTIGFEDLAERARDYTPERAGELTGIAPEQIVAAARLYANGPSTFLSGHGIDAFAGGVQAFRAYHCLVSICGNVDRAGGNLRDKKPKGLLGYIELLHRPELRLGAEAEAETIGAEAYPLWSGSKAWQMACHNPSVIEAILTGRPYPVRAAYISGVNILLTYPDTRRTIEAMKALDFVVVAGHQMTPTAEWADIVLPKTTSIEEEEVSYQGIGQAVLLSRAVPARGEARCEIEIARPLLDRMAKRQALTRDFLPWSSQREFNAFLLQGSDVSLQELAEQGCVKRPFRLGNFEEKPFPTPSGRIELRASMLAQHGLDPLPGLAPGPIAARPEDASGYPFQLITGDREKQYHHSRFREQAWARKVSPHPRLLMHPEDASALALADDAWVVVEAAGVDGGARLKLKISDATPPGIVSTGMGWWRPDVATPDHGVLDGNINAVLSYSGPYDPVTGSASIRGQRCRVRRAPQHSPA
ncbi:MAG: molybdopterin-dependent oxidoreductase [Hyphomicrobiaceae bacterium]|nr:molybdopterin-dependent oxidoreductase [Hyphomicrobiaceae bacterium]